MPPFTILLDAPADAKSRLQIARLGEFDGGSRYGEFSITRDDVEAWRRNLEYLPGKRALIDLDHRADRQPRNTEAAGWITDVGWDGDTPVAEVEWTPVGKQAIADKRYLFFSPTYGTHKTEDGSEHENTLIGGALTNRPFLTGLPAITLASDETIGAAVEQLTGENDLRLLDVLTAHRRSHPAAATERADSRPPMNPDLLKLLDLGDDADDAKILEAVTALKAKPAVEPAKPSKKELRKLLEQEAADGGLVLLDKGEVKQLQTQAASGALAMKQLHQATFDNAFTQALKDRKVTPGEKDDLHKVYELDSTLALKLMDDRQPIMPDKPQGDPVITLDLDEPLDPERVAAAGIYPNSAELDRQIRKHMLDNKIPESGYARLLEQFSAGEVIL